MRMVVGQKDEALGNRHAVDRLENDGVAVRSHIDNAHEDECGYCGQLFGPDDIVIEREIYARKWRFCSEECYRDFRENSNFKDPEE